MDDLDRRLLALLDAGIPFASHPFEIMGRRMGADTAEVLLRIDRLKEQKIIRHISGIFDAHALGYKILRVAMRVPESELEKKALILRRHPGVVLSGRRNHFLNFWFTLAMPGWMLEEHVHGLHKLCASQTTLTFPVLKAFASAGKWFLAGTMEHNKSIGEGEEKLPSSGFPEFEELELKIIRLLQGDFPLTDEPYQRMSRDLGISEAELMERVRSLIHHGYLKRVAPVFYPDKHSNLHPSSLVVWQVPEEKEDEMVLRMSRFEEILHCYRCPVYPEFLYPIHTQIRGTAAHVEKLAQRIQDEIGGWPRLDLPWAKEYQRTRMRFFPEALEAWGKDPAGITKGEADEVKRAVGS